MGLINPLEKERPIIVAQFGDLQLTMIVAAMLHATEPDPLECARKAENLIGAVLAHVSQGSLLLAKKRFEIGKDGQ